MSNSYAVHKIKLKPGSRIHAAQSCLYSNQIEPISAQLLGEERCAFAITDSYEPGVYARDHLLAVRFLPKSWAKKISQLQINADELETLLREHLVLLQDRKTRLLRNKQEAFRWVHGDADGIPGIVVDNYGSLVVIQSGSPTGDFLLPALIRALSSVTDKAIFERSSGQIRTLEKLPERTRWIRETSQSQKVDLIETKLSGLSLSFRPQRCQKTGLFLDQRENLLLLQEILANTNAKNMLDLCSYAGAWSCAAATQGVQEFTAVDQDKDALELCEKNIRKNGTSAAKIELLHGDLFEALAKLNKDSKKFDVVVADPPAFTKSAKHIPEAKRAYQRLTKLASRTVNVNGIYVACSCSRHISEEDFYEIVSSALETDDWVYLGRGRQSPDHTVLAADKHSLYLKSLVFVRRAMLSQFSNTGKHKAASID